MFLFDNDRTSAFLLPSCLLYTHDTEYKQGLYKSFAPMLLPTQHARY